MSRCGRVWLSSAVSLALVLAAVGAFAGRLLSAPASAPAKADLIVALGGDGGSRVLEAARLYREGWAPRIVLTGIDGGDPAARDAFLEWRAVLLADRGVPREALLFERSAGNSREEAAAVFAWMQRGGWRRALVVSDPPHLRRLQRIWGRTFRGSDLEFRLIASTMPRWDANRWWRDEKSAQFVLMELIKLGYDLVCC
ncbi:MAG: YdcF family protein [Rhodocyclaceae bacterium]